MNMVQNPALEKKNIPEISIHCVHFSTVVTDRALCVGLATDPQKNALCISSGCKSVFKPCPICLVQGELKRIGHRPETCCEDGKDSCAFHLASGIGAKRKQIDVERIKRMEFSFDLSRMLVDYKPEKTTVDAVPASQGASNAGYFMVKRSRTRRDPQQPRRYFSKSKLLDLAESIKEFGQKNPVTVRRIFDDPDHDWELVNGERRYRACGMLGIEEMKAVIDDPVDKKHQFLDAVIMNFNAETHTPMEIAHAIQKIKNDFHYSDEKIGKTVFGGKSSVWVGGYLNLVNLHPQVQAMLNPEISEKEQLNASVAIYLARQESDQNRQLEIARRIIQEEMKTSHALAFIRDKATPFHSEERKTSLRGKCRRRKPADDYCILRDLVARTERSLKLHTEMGRGKIKAMFAHRSYDDREKVCQILTEIIKDAKKIRDILEEMT